jgi:hypothetical protein
MTPSSPWCPRAHDIVEPTLSLSPQRRHPPQARKATLYIFLCHFGPTNPDFDILHCDITLTCYIAFVLLHCFCSAALLWYATLPHCFDILHCHNALICYIVFVLLHCFDMLHCFCSATFWSIWMHTTLLNGKSGLSEMSVATWTNIIVLLRFKLRTTCSK